MSEENSNVSEEPVNAEAAAGNETTAGTETAGAETEDAKCECGCSCQSVAEKITEYNGKVDACVESAIGFVGNRPWEDWLKVANTYITRLLPAAIAVAGVLAFVTALVSTIRMNAPFSDVVNTLWILVPTLFSIHLAPKALALMRSFVEKREAEAIRPELMYIMKVVCGIGGLLLGAYLLLCFNSDLVVPAIVAVVFALLMVICLGRPEIVGVKPGNPENCVEEIIALVLFPVKVVIALMTPLIGLAAVCGIVYGIVLWFDDGLEAAFAFGITAVLPLVLPLVVYFTYLLAVCTLDLYRAIVSIPRKLDELKK